MNTVTDLATTVGSGAITEAGTILSSPIGYLVLFFLGLSILGAVVFAVKSWMRG